MLPNTESIFSENESLKTKVSGLELRVKIDQEKLKHYESEVSRLNEMLRDLQRQKFGKKSERWESAEQLVFNEVEALAASGDGADDDESDEETEIEVKAHTKKRGHRRALSADLEREELLIELPPEECFAEDGTPLKIIGYEVSEKLSYEPAKTKVIVHKRAKYGVDSGDYEKTAPPVHQLFQKVSRQLSC